MPLCFWMLVSIGMSTCHQCQKVPSLRDSLQLQLDMGMSMPERVLARLSNGWARAKKG
jgi:hypothetical protein